MKSALLLTLTIKDVVPFSPSPIAQLRQANSSNYHPWKTHKNPIFIHMSGTEIPSYSQIPQRPSSSFPQTLKLPSLHSPDSILPPTVSHPTDDDFAENPHKLFTLQLIPNGYRLDPAVQSEGRVFIQDPPWISSLFDKSLLFRNRSRSGVKIEFQEMERRKKNNVKKCGVIECAPLVLSGLDQAVRHMDIPYVPMLVPPEKWKGQYDKGGYLFLPSYLMRTRGSRKQQEALKAVPSKQMQKVYDALDTLGNTKWRVNKRILGVVESIWESGGNLAGLVNREDVPIPGLLMDDAEEVKKWKWSVRNAQKINRERHSERCDTELKLSVCEILRKKSYFFSCNRFPYLGSKYSNCNSKYQSLPYDCCSAIYIYYVVNCNSFFYCRMDRAMVCNIMQLLFFSTYFSIHVYSCVQGVRFFIKLDGSFQLYYFALNRWFLKEFDFFGYFQFEAAAVNLVAGDKPADVYSEIAEVYRIFFFFFKLIIRVLNIMKRDSEKDPAEDSNALLAKLLIGQVDRKLVKQTVMTSVYGVIYIGAREQIKRRLEEKGLITDERLLFSAACYAAKVTLAAVGELFQAARAIMGWLSDCAKIIASENEPVRVHDSFWTHACDVDRMSKILRQKFGDLYNMRILENLLESFETSYPTLTFPPLPDRGDFDLNQVLESPYFFN
ncbi:DNA-directed RNA polymerase 3- chloroplastic [Striga hermonthica]|uniref:DNA-directed RNA polymerase n=1 Tax=Striga hermonthica TaxID=68872 RepID=A0A9N7P3J1_STRHE|nr:DNA-directed RNA polymerase 3- chloroplastic [Striga hermonthica]